MLLCLLVLTPGSAIAEKLPDAFAIRSNIIKSWIQYSIKVSDDFMFQGDAPVIVFRKRPSGSTRGLSYFERRYYGIESQKIIDDSTVEILIKALPSKKITIKKKYKNTICYIEINGTNCILLEAKIYAKKGLLMDYDGYIEITGQNVLSKKIQKERIYK